MEYCMGLRFFSYNFYRFLFLYYLRGGNNVPVYPVVIGYTVILHGNGYIDLPQPIFIK